MARIRVVVMSVCAVLMAMLLSSPGTHAQMGNTGFVGGLVTDPSGAAIVGATVTLKDIATGKERSDTTNESGRFSFSSVVPARYDITVAKSGFRQLKFADQEVVVGESRTFDAKLEIGAPTETVEVVAANTELQTLNATIGNTVTSTAIDALPSLNRDVSTFVELQPGVSPDGSVAGAVVDQSTFMLDGGNNSNDMDGSMSVYTASYAGDPTGGISNQSNGVAAGPTGVMPTPADSVEEFKVNSAQQTADFNSSAGAQIQIVTRRGTDQFHGSAYYYYLDNTMSANTWQNNASDVPVPDWHRSRFGGRAGGKISPKPFLGGNWYLFGNYEGYRWPFSQTIERTVPSDAMRQGLLTFGGVTYNLNPYPVTFNGNTYGANAGCNGPCDPRGIGINSLVQGIWNQNVPQSNEASCGLGRCDGVNVVGFRANLAVPQTSNFGVVRLDHDIGQKWHIMASYRYFKLDNATTDQVDIGGLIGNDKVGVPTSHSSDPQLPWYYVVGVTTSITSNVTNDFHYNFLRNWWAWGRAGDIPQLDGLGGALEPFGESSTQVLIPYNVNTQQTRTRFWDGHDNMIRDDVSWLKGNHLIQFGGTYQHNWNYHQRTDNGGGINYQPVYQLGKTSGAGINMTGVIPSTVAKGDATNFGRDYVASLGIVSIAQQAYTRSGSDLTLNPPLTPASDKSTIPFYNLYISDSWRIKPTITLNYGLGWTLEMPPVEQDGKQILFVDQNNKPIPVENYLNARENAALNGKPYDPLVGFNLVHNTGRKYPYNPYYDSFSPRVSVAWSPHFSDNWLGDIFGQQGQSVIRGGYNRIYGRLNGVDLVLVPLLGTGLIQPVQCIGALNPAAAAAAGNPCAGSSGANPTNAFRVGTDGLTAPIPPAAKNLPQPLFPGVNGIAAGAGEALDPNFRPNVIDSWNLTIQRQFKRSFLVEVGYIGRKISHEYQPLNINTVPYMMTKGGQRFDKAYANVVLQYCGGVQAMGGGNCAGNAAAVKPQPFFEAALSGTGYCNGFASCTAAMVANEGVNGSGNLTNASVWSLWSDLDQGGSAPGFNFGRTMLNTQLNCPTGSEIGCNGQLTSGVGINASVGYGNYNAGFVTFKVNDWHGMTAQSNFTYGKALSTQSVVQATSEDTAVDPFDLGRGYGLTPFDRKYIFNVFVVYQPPFYKSQQGIAGHLLGGWTFGPIFTAGSGLPVTLGTINGGGQAFGEGDSSNFFGNGNSENAIPIGPLGNASGVHYNPTGTSGCGNTGIGTGGFGPNLFSNPAQAFCNIRQPILGLDNKDGGWGVIRGLGYWNMDLSAQKQIRLTERFNLQLSFIFINVFNHVNFEDPAGDYVDTSNPGSFGTLPGVATASPRTMEFGLRLNF